MREGLDGVSAQELRFESQCITADEDEEEEEEEQSSAGQSHG